MKPLILLIVFAASACATLYTSVANGTTTWSQAATWSPAGVPGRGDQVSCRGSLVVDVGSSVQSIQSYAGCQLVINSSLTVATGGIPIHANNSLKPSIILSNGASLTCLGSNPEIVPDGQGAYVMVQALGTVGAGTSITGCSGNANNQGDGGGLVATWLTLTADHWYWAPDFWAPVTWNVQHSVLNTNVLAAPSLNGQSIMIDRYNQYLGNSTFYISSSGGARGGFAFNSGGQCTVEYDAFSKQFGLSADPLASLSTPNLDACQVDHNVMLNGISYGGDGSAIFDHNFVAQNPAINIVVCGQITNNVFWNATGIDTHSGTPNLCWTEVTPNFGGNADGTFLYTGNIMDSLDITMGRNDGLGVPKSSYDTSPVTTTATVLVNHNIVLRAPDGFAAMEVGALASNYYGVFIVFDHNTAPCGGGGSNACFVNVTEFGPPYLSNIGQLTNNLGWASAATTATLWNAALSGALAYQSDVIPRSSTGHNATWNLAATLPMCTSCTGQGGSYVGKYSQSMASGAPGDVPLTAAPGFANMTANVVQFATKYGALKPLGVWESAPSDQGFQLGDIWTNNNAANLDALPIIWRCIRAHAKSTLGSEPGSGYHGTTSAPPIWTQYWEPAVTSMLAQNVTTGVLVTDPAIGCSGGCDQISALVNYVSTGYAPSNTALYAASDATWIGAVPGVVPGAVASPTLQSIAVAPSAASIAVGETQQFMVTGTYSDGGTQDITSSVSWTSGTPSVATITPTGVATATASGKSIIAATSGSVTGSTLLTVEPRFVRRHEAR